MRLMRALDASAVEGMWTAEHHGQQRVIWRHDTAAWLRTGTSTAGEVVLPEAFNIITGLPDISEVKAVRSSPREYEEWVIQTTRQLVELLPPDHVAILYVTPGRYSGQGGAWLDKSFLCQLGARQAGADCVWQKIVLIQDSVGRRRGGRPGFVNLVCCSKNHRVPQDFVTVDVLPDRGHMAWSHAIGEEACRTCVEYCQQHVGTGNEPILNPFAGYGSVLAVANACGLDSFGMDISLKCCRKAAAHDVSSGTLARIGRCGRGDSD